MKSSLTNAELVKKVRHWVHKLCHSNGRAWVLRIPADRNEDPDLLIVELCERFIKCDKNHAEFPEEIQRLHESADRMAKRIAEQREAGIDLNGDAQAMATASIKREVERCRALLGEIEAEYLPQDIMLDPLVECWHCKAKHLCDPMDATCSKCGAPFDKARCEEFGFKPDFGKETEG